MWMMHGPAEVTCSACSLVVVFIYGMQADDVANGAVKLVSMYACHCSMIAGLSMDIPSFQCGEAMPATFSEDRIHTVEALSLTTIVDQDIDPSTKEFCCFFDFLEDNCSISKITYRGPQLIFRVLLEVNVYCMAQLFFVDVENIDTILALQDFANVSDSIVPLR